MPANDLKENPPEMPIAVSALGLKSSNGYLFGRPALDSTQRLNDILSESSTTILSIHSHIQQSRTALLPYAKERPCLVD